jgi:16S rRNA (uracil1498-N3)-methyltransferase
MRIPRLFVDCELTPDRELTLPEDAARHVRTVLRLRTGAQVRVFNGAGGEYHAILTVGNGGRPAVRVHEYVEVDRESPLPITLLQGVSRSSRMDYTLQKAVELGVAAIEPVICRRSTVRLDARRAETRLIHWRGVVVHACEQCGRTRVPSIRAPEAFKGRITDAGDGSRIVLDPRGEMTLKDMVKPLGAVRLLAGPEGGLDEQELEQARARGFTSLRLGPRILRTETAAVAALAAIQALWGDLA